MIDADLAELYGVPTKALNQALKRNRDRFPPDFGFRLSRSEKIEVVQGVTTSPAQVIRHPHRTPSPSTVRSWPRTCSTARAVAMSVHVVRAFVRLREVIASHKELVKRLDEVEGATTSSSGRLRRDPAADGAASRAKIGLPSGAARCCCSHARDDRKAFRRRLRLPDPETLRARRCGAPRASDARRTLAGGNLNE
jgi:hypothetical protein